MSQGIVTTSRHAQTTGGVPSPPVGIALRAAAVVTYLIGAWALLAQLVAGSGFDVGAEVTPASP
ncbi:MAG TPA: hypothetical protein VFA49_00495, partial [Chloroflexota bacterium]|nr:hypothetical protein [Chloroflexota bacterium]